MQREAIITRLYSYASGATKEHPYYERVCKLDKEYSELFGGKNIHNQLKQFTRRESAELFKQRKEITFSVAPSVASSLAKVFQKIPRANFEKELTYGNGQEDKLSNFKEIVGKFYGSKNVEQYLADKFVWQNILKPNDFVVIEFKDFDPNNENAQPYPYEVDCKNIPDFQYENQELQFVTVQTSYLQQVGNEQKEKRKLTCYLANETIVLHEVELVNNRLGIQLADNQSLIELTDGKNKTNWVQTLPIPHNAGRVPAFRWGYAPDVVTDSATCVSVINECVPFLKKTLKTDSELDLSMALHAFPLSIRYADKCENPACNKGLVASGETCQTCKGTGRKNRPTSTQEEIVIDFPDNPSIPLPDLSKMFASVTPDVAFLKFMSEYIKEKIEEAYSAVFNSDIFTKQEVSQTATEKRINQDNVYDTLLPGAVQYKALWEGIIFIIGRFTDLGEGLIYSLNFDKDFKLKSLNDLLIDLEQAQASGNTALIQKIQRGIARITMKDDKEALARWETIARFDPFFGFSDEKIAMAMLSPHIPDRQKVTHYNITQIVDELVVSNPNFYTLTAEKQRPLVNAAIEELQTQLQPVAPQLI